MTPTKRLETAMAAAVAAGNVLMKHYDDVLTVSTKESLRDVVTVVDELAEGCVVETIKRAEPGACIVSEEGVATPAPVSDCYWIVDALDGTVNYVNHIPMFGVSIAFVEGGRPVIGVVYNPVSNDLYYGGENLGIYKNQQTLKIQDRPPQECSFSVAFSGKNYDPVHRRLEFLLMAEVNDASRGCLRTGSASMNLAYLAEGKFGGCWGKANKLWDIGAGLLLARLAGAKVVFNEIDPSKHLVSYIAASPSAWSFLYEKAHRVLGLNATEQ